MKNHRQQWLTCKKNIENPLTPMVPWLKPLTIPLCPKINHRYGLYRDHYFEQIFKKCGTPCKCSPTWVPPAAFDNVACLLVGWCLLSSLNQTVQRKIEGGKLCVKGWHSRVESEVRTKQDLSKLCEFSIKSCVKFRTYSQRLHRHSYHLVWVSGYHGATYNPLPPFLSLL